MGGEADSMSAAATTVSMCKTSWLIDDDGLDDFSCLPLFQLFFYGSCNHCPYSDCIFFWILFADSTHTHTLSLSLSLSLSLLLTHQSSNPEQHHHHHQEQNPIHSFFLFFFFLVNFVM
jgi:hypothetical protein